MKDAFKYVGAGILGTILLMFLIAAIAMLPAIPAMIAAIASVAIALLPGALLIYGLIYLYRRKKNDKGIE